MAYLPDISKLQDSDETQSLIENIFGADLVKKIYYHCCRIDIEDNNEKAELLQELLGPEFVELGTGTNRMAYIYNPSPDREFLGGANLVYSIALDRRGLIDNWTEFKRSTEIPEFMIKCYETNMLILIEEYVTLMDKEEFVANENGIKSILEELSKAYIFEDIGFNLKNQSNYGYRQNGDIVILDAGYVYPLGASAEIILSCPRCKGRLRYNSNYTAFQCSNTSCKAKYSFMEIRRRMDLSLEDMENQMISELNSVEMPDFETFIEDIYDDGMNMIDNENEKSGYSDKEE